MKTIVFAVYIMLSNHLFAQDSTAIFIAAGRNVSEVLTPAKIYQLPEFINGKIMFRNASSTQARLNYNFLNGEIEFIGPAKDTLAIAKNQLLNIKEILLDNNSFFYDNGYLEMVTNTAFGKLARKRMLVVARRVKLGAYDRPASTTDPDTHETIFLSYGIMSPTFKLNENVTLALRTTYFIGDEFNHFLPASKKNMIKLYSLKKPQIETYLNKNFVDFRNGEDLKKMFTSL